MISEYNFIILKQHCSKRNKSTLGFQNQKAEGKENERKEERKQGERRSEKWQRART